MCPLPCAVKGYYLKSSGRTGYVSFVLICGYRGLIDVVVDVDAGCHGSVYVKSKSLFNNTDSGSVSHGTRFTIYIDLSHNTRKDDEQSAFEIPDISGSK